MTSKEWYRCKVDLREYWSELDAYLKETTKGTLWHKTKVAKGKTYLHFDDLGVTYWLPTSQLSKFFQKTEALTEKKDLD